MRSRLVLTFGAPRVCAQMRAYRSSVAVGFGALDTRSLSAASVLAAQLMHWHRGDGAQTAAHALKAVPRGVEFGATLSFARPPVAADAISCFFHRPAAPPLTAAPEPSPATVALRDAPSDGNSEGHSAELESLAAGAWLCGECRRLRGALPLAEVVAGVLEAVGGEGTEAKLFELLGAEAFDTMVRRHRIRGTFACLPCNTPTARRGPLCSLHPRSTMLPRWYRCRWKS